MGGKDNAPRPISKKIFLRCLIQEHHLKFDHRIFIDWFTLDSVKLCSLRNSEPVFRLPGLTILLIRHFRRDMADPRHPPLRRQAQLINAFRVKEVGYSALVVDGVVGVGVRPRHQDNFPFVRAADANLSRADEGRHGAGQLVPQQLVLLLKLLEAALCFHGYAGKHVVGQLLVCVLQLRFKLSILPEILVEITRWMRFEFGRE